MTHIAANTNTVNERTDVNNISSFYLAILAKNKN